MFLLLLLLLALVLETEIRAVHTQGRCSTVNLHPTPTLLRVGVLLSIHFRGVRQREADVQRFPL